MTDKLSLSAPPPFEDAEEGESANISLLDYENESREGRASQGKH